MSFYSWETLQLIHNPDHRQRKGKTEKVLVFQHSWLVKYGRLVYSPAAEGRLCKYCTLFASKNDKRKYVGVLVSKPFVNFVKAVGKDGVLENHQNNQYHKDAVQRGLLLIQHAQIPECSMPYLISQANRHVYQKNIIILKSIVEAVVFYGKQVCRCAQGIISLLYL